MGRVYCFRALKFVLTRDRRAQLRSATTRICVLAVPINRETAGSASLFIAERRHVATERRHVAVALYRDQLINGYNDDAQPAERRIFETHPL